MIRRIAFTVVIQAAVAGTLLAQQEAAAARAAIPPAAEQIAAAVLALPVDMRPGATVLGYDPQGRLITLRTGTNRMVCLAHDPAVTQRFHVACYHDSLEPFMARGRELRAQGITAPARVDSIRNAEIAADKLPMPRIAAGLYALTGPAGGFDASAGVVKNGRPRFVLYMPFATAESTGLPTNPSSGGPWLMDPGTAKAHLMISIDM